MITTKRNILYQEHCKKNPINHDCGNTKNNYTT